MVKSSQKPKSGFALVLEFYEKKAKETGASGVKTLMASDLEVTRQIVHVWAKKGIPITYRDKLCKLTGLTKEQIWPEIFN